MLVLRHTGLRARNTTFLSSITVALAFAVTGCSHECEYGPSCPTPLDIGQLCSESGPCTIAGAAAQCDVAYGCLLLPSQTLEVALDGASLDGAIPELLIRDYVGTPPIDATDVQVKLDGIDGKLLDEK